MSLTAVIILVILGLALIILEIFILPGLIVGFIGIGLLVAGVACAYHFLGSSTGHIILIGSAVSSLILLYFSLKSSTWNRVSLGTSLHGKTNTIDHMDIKPGDEGVALSRLAPIGNALIKDHIVEVQSMKDFIDQNVAIKVLRVDGNKIIVEQKR